MGPCAVQLHLRWRPPGRPDRLRHRAPGARIRDVAQAIYRFAPLTASDGTVGIVSPAEQARRARLFCDQCGEADRGRVIKAQWPAAARPGRLHAGGDGEGRRSFPAAPRWRP